MTPNNLHIPVLLDEVLAALAPKDGGVYVDGTFGAGGYTAAILAAADTRVIAIDRDPLALPLSELYRKRYGERFSFFNACFSQMAELVGEKVDGVVLDLGVSSMQIDNPARGFSFQKNGLLDMRMSLDGETAADVVNTMPEGRLADIIYEYGEERHARRVAKAIAARRGQKPFASTLELAEVIASVVPRAKDGISPATRTFQALRIYVNNEMGELGAGLQNATELLKVGGRLAVVSFHSLEDGRVKSFMKKCAGKGAEAAVSRYMPAPTGAADNGAGFKVLTPKPVSPSADEVKANPRARSGKLRVMERVAEVAKGKENEAAACPLLKGTGGAR